MEKTTSTDGTTLAFDRSGVGPVLILVAGAACDRGVNAPIAQALARHFTVLNYDRRGRGDSADTPPYAVAREVEDIAALVAAAGMSPILLGFSSGAALAAEATASGLPVDRLIMWEPPFSTDPDGPRRAKEYADRLAELLAADRRDDALAHFMTHVGVPPQVVAGTRRSPYWQAGLRLAPTLAYDAAILADTTVPTARYAQIGVPTLVLSGAASPEFLRTAAEQAAGAIPGARHDVLPGQDHNVAGESLAPVVAAFAGR
ncbi:alpha/beta hydrolase [Micromonospora sp. C28SCA-DRY-2]|uniref:alpha/beta fold hydrolase n=1 Tax=Micromonospora sp. C28SCA-DRY-2 TaxID=3059522 RepID=UPI002675BE77|nr:alpha/beta hydrolase [Micromonospora sp. C28SCA-DRY-2]MDO3703129.1 alpha/beta hydrolase [Micromonospora sp. C28SCA-DRY-2]